MSTLEVNTISPISGSSDVTLGGSSKNIKFASGTTVDFSTNTPTLSGIPLNGTGNGFYSRPNNSGSWSSTQSISSGAFTGEGTLLNHVTGLRHTYKSNFCLKATLMDLIPPPTGVVNGPLIAIKY